MLQLFARVHGGVALDGTRSSVGSTEMEPWRLQEQQRMHTGQIAKCRKDEDEQDKKTGLQLVTSRSHAGQGDLHGGRSCDAVKAACERVAASACQTVVTQGKCLARPIIPRAMSNHRKCPSMMCTLPSLLPPPPRRCHGLDIPGVSPAAHRGPATLETALCMPALPQFADSVRRHYFAMLGTPAVCPAIGEMEVDTALAE